MHQLGARVDICVGIKWSSKPGFPFDVLTA